MFESWTILQLCQPYHIAAFVCVELKRRTRGALVCKVPNTAGWGRKGFE